MSLTRKALAAMGIESEKIDSIINMHTEVTDDLKGQIETLENEVKGFKAETEKHAETEKRLEELKQKVEADAKEREGKDYDKLREEFDNYKAEQERKAVRASKEAAYKDILKDAGIPERHYAKILKYSDVDGIELDDKGKVKDSKDLLKAIREEWKEEVETEGARGADTPNPPSNTGGSARTKEEIMAIKDTAERQKAIAENADLFGLG